MAAAAPSHRIHSIHGSFGASRYSPSLSLSPAQASWNRIPNVCAPRTSYEPMPVARTTPASLSASASGPGGSPNGLGARSVGPSASGSRPRRTTMSHGSYGGPMPIASRRAPPPPPVPQERTTSALVSSLAAAPAIPSIRPAPAHVPIPEIEDPFKDAEQPELSPFPPVSLTPTSSSPIRTSASASVSMCRGELCGASSAAVTVTVPPGLTGTIPSAKDMRGRLVANALLSRGSGRPLGVYLRRRLAAEGQTYVKSGLSRLVAAAA